MKVTSTRISDLLSLFFCQIITSGTLGERTHTHTQYEIQSSLGIRQSTTPAGISQMVVHERTFIILDQRGVIRCKFAFIIEARQHGLMHTVLPCEAAHSVLVQIVKIISSCTSRRTLKTLTHHKGGEIHANSNDNMTANQEQLLPIERVGATRATKRRYRGFVFRFIQSCDFVFGEGATNTCRRRFLSGNLCKSQCNMYRRGELPSSILYQEPCTHQTRAWNDDPSAFTASGKVLSQNNETPQTQRPLSSHEHSGKQT